MAKISETIIQCTFYNKYSNSRKDSHTIISKRIHCVGSINDTWTLLHCSIKISMERERAYDTRRDSGTYHPPIIFGWNR